MEQTICKRCGKPIKFNSVSQLAITEGMHWVCFHLEYEHISEDGKTMLDPDEPCSDPSCFWTGYAFKG